MKPVVHIENWKVDGKYLWGIPKDHPSSLVSNKCRVKTSPIVRIETMNTIYELGKHFQDETNSPTIMKNTNGVCRNCGSERQPQDFYCFECGFDNL